MKNPKAPTGQRIVLELVKEMQDRLYPLFYRTLAPGLYHVYLHPDDYREIEGVAGLIAADAQSALNARVTRLNRRRRWSALLSHTSSVEAPPAGWEIHIHPEANGEIERGQIGIVSRLSVPAAPHFEGGTPTTRIVRTVVTSTTRRSVASDEALSPSPPAPTAPAAAGPTLPMSSPALPAPAVPVATLPQPTYAPATEKPPVASTQEVESLKGFARLAYVDEQGPHVYAMKKDVVSIGRGGREHWVDVQLVTTARVSREHCRIRRDDSGRFFLHDLSTWGTSVDGTPVRPAGAADAASQGAALEQELPPEARIQLADALVIEFQAQPGT